MKYLFLEDKPSALHRKNRDFESTRVWLSMEKDTEVRTTVKNFAILTSARGDSGNVTRFDDSALISSVSRQ